MTKSIRIISPSGAINSDYIEGASRRLRSYGYIVKEAEHARGQYGRFAASDNDRLIDINEAISSNSDILLCSRGGYGLQRLVSRLDKPNKPLPLLVGFSDITILHQWWGLHGAKSIHGLMCKHIATLPEDSEPLLYWQHAVNGEPLSYSIKSHSLNRIGQVSGTLIGGNLSVLYGLQDTPFSLSKLIDNLHDNEKPILFIEDIDERHYHIERMMLNLKMSGVFERLGGLIVGQFIDCEDDNSMGCTIYETIAKIVDEYNYPVIFDFPAGHVEYNLPLRLNSPITLTVDYSHSLLLN